MKTWLCSYCIKKPDLGTKYVLFNIFKCQVEGIWCIYDCLCCSICLLSCQEKVKAVFDNLIHLEHANIVKFHKYWADTKDNRARVSICYSSPTIIRKIRLLHLVMTYFFIRSSRSPSDQVSLLLLSQVIFITEYMSSGSLKQFLKKTKKNHKTMNEKVLTFTITGKFLSMSESELHICGMSHQPGLLNHIKHTVLLNNRIQLVALLMSCLVPQALKRWCTQILSALKWVSFYHECSIQHARCDKCSQVIFTNKLCGGVLFLLLQLSPLLWPSHHPRQPDLWHHLHPTQWAHQDRLRYHFQRHRWQWCI